MEVSASLGEMSLKLSEEVGILQIAKADYYKFKGEANERLNNLEIRASESENKISDLELSLLESNANLGDEILKNAQKIGLIGTYLKINF